MPTKREYLERLRTAVQQLHACSAVHVYTSAVNVRAAGRSVWEGDVEVFAITSHPEASRCYAWAHREGKDFGEARYVAVLSVPPVTSPEAAVRASLAADERRARA